MNTKPTYFESMGKSIEEWPINMDETLAEVVKRPPIENVLDFDEPRVGKQIIIDRLYDEENCNLVEETRSLLSGQPVIGDKLGVVLILEDYK